MLAVLFKLRRCRAKPAERYARAVLPLRLGAKGYPGGGPSLCCEVGRNVHSCVQRAERSTRRPCRSRTRLVLDRPPHRSERPRPHIAGGTRQGQCSSSRAKSVDRSVCLSLFRTAQLFGVSGVCLLCFLVRVARSRVTCGNVCSSRVETWLEQHLSVTDFL